MLTKKAAQRAQSLTEFALVLPILLFMMMGIFDFGRALFTYIQASASVRNALRFGTSLGYDTATPRYLNCTQMGAMANAAFFDTNGAVSIDFLTAASGLTTSYNCVAVASNPNLVQDGDVLRITYTATIPLITPFMPVSNFPISIEGRRTLARDVEFQDLEPVVPTSTPGGLYNTDSDGDGLMDGWEIARLGNLNSTGTDDSDADGCNNLCEYTFNTNPNPATGGNGSYPTISTPTGLAQNVMGSQCNTYGSELYVALQWNASTTTAPQGVEGYEIWANNGSSNTLIGRVSGTSCGGDSTSANYCANAIGHAAWETLRQVDLTYTVRAYRTSYLVSAPSAPVTVGCWLVPDSDVDGLLDAWEWTHFTTLSVTGSEDPDSDACNNECEESFSTDPNSNSSTPAISQPGTPVINGGATNCTSAPPYVGLTWTGSTVTTGTGFVQGYRIYADNGSSNTLIGQVTGLSCGGNASSPDYCANVIGAGAFDALRVTPLTYTIVAYGSTLNSPASAGMNYTCNPSTPPIPTPQNLRAGVTLPTCHSSNSGHSSNKFNLTWDSLLGSGIQAGDVIRLYASPINGPQSGSWQLVWTTSNTSATSCSGQVTSGPNGCFSSNQTFWSSQWSNNSGRDFNFRLVVARGGTEGSPATFGPYGCP